MKVSNGARRWMDNKKDSHYHNYNTLVYIFTVTVVDYR